MNIRAIYDKKNNFIFLIMVAAILLVPKVLFATSLQLSWNANEESDIAGYIIYYGTNSWNDEHSIDVGNTTSYELSGLEEGVKYYIALKAYDYSGNKSCFSKPVITKNCYFLSTVMTIPPYVLFLSPCIDNTSKKKRFSLFPAELTVQNQTGNYSQDATFFKATCQYDLEIFGMSFQHYWELTGQHVKPFNFFIFGDLTLDIAGSEWDRAGMGFFYGWRMLK